MHDQQRAVDRLERLFGDRLAVADGRSLVAEIADRARSLGRLSGTHAEVIAGLSFIGEAFAGLSIERAWSRTAVDEVVAEAAGILSVDPAAVRVVAFTRAVVDPRLSELPPRLAIETRVGLLRAFTPVPTVSLWAADDGGMPRCVLHDADDPRPPRRARSLARAILEGRADEVDDGARSLLHVLPIDRWEQPYAALVVKVQPAAREATIVLAREVSRTLGSALEFEALLERNSERERSLVEAGERRLVRLGFDLHDGPMQDAAALAAEIRHFREQLSETLADDPPRAPLVGRVDDIEARVRALDADLREISQALNTPVVLRLPLRDVVQRELEIFGRRSGIDVTLHVSGDFEQLSTSQRIALLRLVQESLANVQSHSSAIAVTVTLAAGRTHTRATIVDNGRGFDVEKTLVAAARRGRLGLVGMGERIRLLGGRFDVRSAPELGTEISAVLPRWRAATNVEPGPE